MNVGTAAGRLPAVRAPSTAAKKRAAALCGGLALLFLPLCLRLYHIQVEENARWRHLRARQSEGLEREFPERGRIWESGLGQLVACSAPRQTVVADPQKVRDAAATAALLAPILKTDEKTLRTRMSNEKRRAVYLRRAVDGRTAARVRALRLPGLFFEPSSRRIYPQGRLLCHVLGCAGTDGGMEGVELRLDALLQGTLGRRWNEYDGRRVPVALSEALTGGPRGRAARDGLDIVLTLDLRLQRLVEDELDRIMREFTPRGASGVVLDPYTGAILALACRPNFNPNRAGSFPPAARRNRVICDQYEPGSTFKSFVAAAALETGIAHPTDRFFCEHGAWRVGYRTLHDAHAYGELDFVHVIVKSSNIGAAKIGLRLGIKGLYHAVRSFGFGRRTGVDLPGEIGGTVRPLRHWKKDSILSVAMGQEIAVTPLQLTVAYAALVNGGMLLRPQLVRKIAVRHGETLYSLRPEPVRRVVSRAVSRRMRDILHRVVVEGTGRRAWNAEYAVGGKTGTAQKVVGGRYGQDKFVGSFCGFAPVETPRLLCLITVDEPDRRKGHYGGVVAAPAVKKVLRRGLEILGVLPRNPEQQAAAEQAYRRRKL